MLDSNPVGVRGTAYDLVYNGTEFGSGSIRIHRPDLQRQVLRVLGLSDAEIDEKFGFLLSALGRVRHPTVASRWGWTVSFSASRDRPA
jgi:aspartyl-tRNA synthetase